MPERAARSRARPRSVASKSSGDYVERVQRARLLAALIEVVGEQHGARPTVSQITSHAGVSRRTFYHLFRDCDDCYAAALDQMFERAEELAAEAFVEHASWREGVRAALACLLRLMDEQPSLARLCLVHSLTAGEAVRRHREMLLRRLAERLAPRRGGSAACAEPAIAMEMVLGGILAVIESRIVKRHRRPLSELQGPLMGAIVLPWLGSDAAREELSVSARRDRRPRRSGSGDDPLLSLTVRMTYRTVRVLVALGDHPESSNRAVAEHAGISDQGQVSKLLARLAAAGLVENLNEGAPNGEPNVWRLTTHGARLERATRPRLAAGDPR